MLLKNLTCDSTFGVSNFLLLLLDLFSTGTLAKYTGGQVYYYPAFQSAFHKEKLRHELARDLTRETAWEAVMRIRCGKGECISKEQFLLNYYYFWWAGTEWFLLLN